MLFLLPPCGICGWAVVVFVVILWHFCTKFALATDILSVTVGVCGINVLAVPGILKLFNDMLNGLLHRLTVNVASTNAYFFQHPSSLPVNVLIIRLHAVRRIPVLQLQVVLYSTHYHEHLPYQFCFHVAGITVAVYYSKLARLAPCTTMIETH